jgi:hypothetical protein
VIVLDRDIYRHPYFRGERFTKREAWMWLVAAAARRPCKRRVGVITVALTRGQLAYSQRFMAARWRWTLARVQRFLERLAAESMIDCVTESGVTCVTIRRFDEAVMVESGVTESEPVTECKQVTESEPVTESATESATESPSGAKRDCRSAPCRDGPQKASQQPSQQPSQINKNNYLSPNHDGGGGGGVARARESYIGEEAFALADEVMRTIGIDPNFPSPGWCGLAMWLQAGLNSGWRPELVRIAVARVRARKGFEIPFTFKYLARPIQREHEAAAEPPLPVPPVGIKPQHHEEPGHAQKSAATATWQESRDRFRAARGKLRAFIEDAATDHCGQDGGQVVRLPAAAGRGRP